MPHCIGVASTTSKKTIDAMVESYIKFSGLVPVSQYGADEVYCKPYSDRWYTREEIVRIVKGLAAC